MSDAAAAFLATAEAAQAGAGIIAARHRGDLASANALLAGLDDREKAAGFLFLADLALALLARAEDRSVDDVAARLSLQIAAQISGFYPARGRRPQPGRVSQRQRQLAHTPVTANRCGWTVNP